MSTQDLAILEKARDPRWRDYVFRSPSRATLIAWGRRLHYFRFCKAIGGFAQDGDHLRVALRCTSTADLRRLLAQLSLPALTQPETQQRCHLARHVQPAGNRAFLTIDWEPALQLNLSVADSENPYDVTASAVAAAAAIEKLLVAHEARIIDPPVASIYCVCPAYYPDLWADLAK
jgi:hypothetical protein